MKLAVELTSHFFVANVSAKALLFFCLETTYELLSSFSLISNTKKLLSTEQRGLRYPLPAQDEIYQHVVGYFGLFFPISCQLLKSVLYEHYKRLIFALSRLGCMIWCFSVSQRQNVFIDSESRRTLRRKPTKFKKLEKLYKLKRSIASWSSGSAFVSGTGSRMFKSRAGQIGYSVANISSPLRHFFVKSCFVRAQWRGDRPHKLVIPFGVIQRV